MNRMLMTGFLMMFSGLAAAAPQWTGWNGLGKIYTYTSDGTLSVYMDGYSCPNAKNYFQISPAHASSAKQLVSMVLLAKANNSIVNIRFEDTIDATHCYMVGFQIQ